MFPAVGGRLAFIIWNFGCWSLGFGFWILGFGFFGLGFWIAQSMRFRSKGSDRIEHPVRETLNPEVLTDKLCPREPSSIDPSTCSNLQLKPSSDLETPRIWASQCGDAPGAKSRRTYSTCMHGCAYVFTERLRGTTLDLIHDSCQHTCNPCPL